jgi:anti-sigma-K factor RskA
MVATMAAQGSPAKLVATWSPGSRTLVIAAAVAPAAARGHAHQLWMIAPGGQPHPMGMMPREGAMRATLPADVAAQLREGVTLAVSVEPEGGSPTGLPTGAVIAAGPLVHT